MWSKKDIIFAISLSCNIIFLVILLLKNNAKAPPSIVVPAPLQYPDTIEKNAKEKKDSLETMPVDNAIFFVDSLLKQRYGTI